LGEAVAASLIFFASILAHELSHSLVARMQGLKVQNITLFLFGGVSNIQRHPPSARAEFLITIVGPLTSIVLGFLFLLGAYLRMGPLPSQPGGLEQLLISLDPLSTLLLWLGPVNIFVGLFNLVPGFPLDGGRIVRSALWSLTGNLQRATRWAAGLGQAVGWLMVLAGIAMVFGARIPFFGTGTLNGLWLAFIGWFLSSAAVQSYEGQMVEDVLEHVPVERLMRSNPPTVAPAEPVSELVYEHIMHGDDYAFPVVQDEQLVGIVTLDDVRKVAQEQWDKTQVETIMTPKQELAVVSPEEDSVQALQLLVERNVRQLPVLRNGALVGLLRRNDIVKWLRLHSQAAPAL
jgi:Zn-dependent protease